MHNGFLGNWSRWRRQVEALIPDELYPSRDRHDRFGSDLSRHDGRRYRRAGGRRGKNPGDAHRLRQSKRAGDRFRFTAALANGRDLYGFRYAVNDRANTLYYRESERGIVIVSEPTDRDKNWVTVPEDTSSSPRPASGRASCRCSIAARKRRNNPGFPSSGHAERGHRGGDVGLDRLGRGHVGFAGGGCRFLSSATPRP